MKKILKFVFIIISCFIINMPITNAQSLNCSQYLSKGSTGKSVSVLQQMLNKTTNCSLDVDGIYGKLTKQCVKKFQNKYNLSVDGIVGPKTCNKLNKVLNKGSKNNRNRGRSINSTNKKAFYVTGNVVNVRKSASSSSKVIAKVRRGKKVEVVETVGNWSHVLVGSTIVGYIKSSLLTNDLIIVDISSQTLAFYKNNRAILKTNVITGMKGSHDTPIGRYILKPSNLERSRTLREYNSYVEYWMPFIMERGIGFHDASWRTNNEYTNNRYTYDGSHGCINMKSKAAKRLYNNITNDTVVIIKK